MNTIKVNIKKPVYGTFCYIRASIVDSAIANGFKLDVNIPQGRAIIDPVEWKKTSKVMKKVFKFPDNPMILYGNYVNVPGLPKGNVVEEEKKTKQQTLL